MPRNYGFIGRKQKPNTGSAGGVIGLNNSYHDTLDGNYPERTTTEYWAGITKTAGQNESLDGCVVDVNGNVYVYGYYQPSSSGDNVSATNVTPYMQKWNSSGVLVWHKFYWHYDTSAATTNINGNIYSAAPSPDGNYIYAIGRLNQYLSSNSQGFDVGILKIDTSDGSVEWWKIYYTSYNSSVNYSDNMLVYRHNIVCGSNTEIYFCFYSRASSDGRDEMKIVKINDSGTVQINKVINPTGNYDYNGSLAARGSYVYVSFYYQSGYGSSDWGVMKLNTSLVTQWAKRYGTSSADQPYTIAVDSNDNVYVGGYANDTYSASTNYDAVIIKFNSSGTYQWARGMYGYQPSSARYNYSEYLWSLAIDSDDNVYASVVYGFRRLAFLVFNSSGTNTNRMVLESSYSTSSQGLLDGYRLNISGNYLIPYIRSQNNEDIILKLNKDLSLPAASVDTGYAVISFLSSGTDNDLNVFTYNATTATTSVTASAEVATLNVTTLSSSNMVVNTPFDDPAAVGSIARRRILL